MMPQLSGKRLSQSIRSFLETMLGVFLALGIWNFTLPTITQALEYQPASKQPQMITLPYHMDKGEYPSSFVIEVHMHYVPYQSGVVRIAPEGCAEVSSVTVNHIPVPWMLPKEQYDEKIVCLTRTFTRDLSDYLQTGDNEISVNVVATKNSRIYIKPVRSTAIMLWIVACIGIVPLHAGLYRLRQNWPRLRAWPRRHRRIFLSIFFMAAATIYAKSLFIRFESWDYAISVHRWLEYIGRHGLRAYGDRFHNYAPLYPYMLGLSDLFFPTAPSLYLIKALTFLGEAVAAYWAYHLTALYCRYRPGALRPWIAAFLVFLTPSVIVNGAAGSQCDVWFTAFLLGALYSLVEQRPVKAMLWAGLAFSFKLQAIFLAPLLLVFVLRREIRWWQVLIIPGVYAILCLPAWLEGRTAYDLISIYWQKFALETDVGSVTDAANIFVYLMDYHSLRDVYLGIFEASATGFLLAYLSWKRWQQKTELISTLLLAALFAGLMPFLLPDMRDRYFFLAEILTLILACLRPRWCLITIMFQWSTIIIMPDCMFPGYPGIINWFRHHTVYTSIALNLLAIASLLFLCYVHIWRKTGFRKSVSVESV